MKDLKDIRYHRSHRQDARIPEAKKYRDLAEKKRDPASIIEELEDVLSETDFYVLDLLAELKEQQNYWYKMYKECNEVKNEHR